MIAFTPMKTPFVAFAMAVSLGSPAGAAVKETHENSFTIEAMVTATRPPALVYRDLVRVALWWDPAHTWSGSARNLRIEARAGGCFCERLPGGGSVEHARIVFAQPGKQLRMVGAFGPLQEMAVVGVLTFKLEPEASGTRITMTYRLSGALTLESTKLAPAVDQVMVGQLARLASMASGRPIGP